MLGQISWRKIGAAIALASFVNLPLVFWSEIVWAKNTQEGRGWPTRRVGGGSRGCSPELSNQPCQPLMALIPNDIVLTASESPTLLFYLPQIRNSQAVTMEFVLRNQADELVYETTFKPTPEGGIIRLTLNKSSSFEGLAVNQDYHWYLSIVYNSSDRAHDDVVEGWVRHVPMSSTLAHQISQASSLKQVQLYQEANLWTEAINTLSYLKQSQPTDLTVAQMWTQMLQSVSLDMPILTQSPLFNSSEPQKLWYSQKNHSINSMYLSNPPTTLER